MTAAFGSPQTCQFPPLTICGVDLLCWHVDTSHVSRFSVCHQDHWEHDLWEKEPFRCEQEANVLHESNGLQEKPNLPQLLKRRSKYGYKSSKSDI